MIVMAASSVKQDVLPAQDQLILNAQRVIQASSCQKQPVMMYAQRDSLETAIPAHVMIALPIVLIVTPLRSAQDVMTIIKLMRIHNVLDALLTVSTVKVTSALNVTQNGSSTLMVPAPKTAEMETLLIQMLSPVFVLNVTNTVLFAMEQTLANVLHVSMVISLIIQQRMAALHVITSVKHV